MDSRNGGRQRNNPASLFRVLGICCLLFVALLFYNGSFYARENSPEHIETFTVQNLTQSVELVAVGDAGRQFAMQEVRRLRCLRQLQKRLHDDFGPFLKGRGGRIVLMDVALHANLGDNVLWKAAVKLITDFGFSPQLICHGVQKAFVDEIDDVFERCDLEKITKIATGGGVVFLHGGGNWGDLYRYVQEGRLDYLRNLTDAAAVGNFSVVQLPQSVNYALRSEYRKLDDTYMQKIKADRFFFATRQKDSLRYVKRHYPKVTSFLTPDIAYILGPIMPTRTPSVDVLIQMRQDIEVKKSDERQYDWIKKQFDNATMTFAYRDWWYHPEENEGELSDTQTSLLGDVRLNAAVDLISQGKILITNRLHGSLLGSLMGRFVFIVDTVENKLRRVHDVRRSVCDDCRDDNLHVFYCGSLREAVSAAIELYVAWDGLQLYY